MTTKTTRYGYLNSLMGSISSMPGLMARGPQVFHSPDEPEGGASVDDTPEEFREQPGDREAEPTSEGVEPPEGDGEEPPPEGEEEPSPEGEGSTEGAEGQEEGAEGQEEPPRKKDWRDRQIAKLREREKAREAELAEIKRRAEAAEALLKAAPEERDAGLVEKTREQIRREEAEKVRQEAYFKNLNDGLEKMDAAGKEAFRETWEDRIVEAREALRDEIVARPEFLEAIVDLPNAAAVYHELAGDLDRMETILKMPAHKMGMELARISDKLAKPPVKPVSKAPKPIRPIDAKGGERDLESLINDPNASMEEIDRRMRAEEKKRAQAH